MKMNFQANQGFAVDSANGLKICPPRKEPGYPPADPELIVFDYPVYRNGDRDAFSVFGREIRRRTDAINERILTLDFNREAMLDSALGIRKS